MQNIFRELSLPPTVAVPSIRKMSAEVVKPSKGAVFRARLTSTLILWAIVTSVFVSQNAWAFFGLVAFLTVAGSLEFFGLFREFPHAGCRVIGIGVGLAVALGGGIGLIGGCLNEEAFLWEMAGLVLVTLGAFCWRFRNGIEGRESVDAVSDSLLAYVYVPILFGTFLFRLLFLPETGGPVPGSWLILMMIASAKFTDMGAYATGSLIGKTKMAPHISPAKTWEGFAGALVFAQLAAWGVWVLAGETLAWIPPMHVAILGVLMALSAVAGDLAESILKRSLGVKDSGSWMPGIGGVLDLIDSLCFAAPVMYFYLIFTGLA